MRRTLLFLAAAGICLGTQAIRAQTGDEPSSPAAAKNDTRMPPSPTDAGTASDEAERPDAVSPMDPALVARDPGPEPMRGPRHGPRGMMPPPPPPSKAAEFRIENGSLKFHVRCAEDEPMQACADIASRLLGQAMGTAPR